MADGRTFQGKPCRKCGHTLRYQSAGLRCVWCALQVSRKYKKKNAEVIKEKGKIYRDGRPEYYQENKERIAENNKRFYERHRPAVLAQKKEYFHKTKPVRLKRMAEYRETHKEELKVTSKQWRDANKEVLSEKRRRYQKENAEIVNARCMERHCKKLQRMPVWADKQAIKEIYANCPKGMHVDHIIPLQGELVSGLHVANNLQYLTPTENCRKHNSFEPLFIENQCLL